MAQPEPAPPNERRPWYYQNWFLIAAFILGWPVTFPFGALWPVWGVLILRSPWHSRSLVKGLAWAMLIVGTVLFIMNLDGPQGPGYAIAIIVPGSFVTLATQVMWSKYRIEHAIGKQTILLPQTPSTNSEEGSPTTPRRPRARRRVHRRRGSGSGQAPY